MIGRVKYEKKKLNPALTKFSSLAVLHLRVITSKRAIQQSHHQYFLNTVIEYHSFKCSVGYGTLGYYTTVNLLGAATWTIAEESLGFCWRCKGEEGLHGRRQEEKGKSPLT